MDRSRVTAVRHELLGLHKELIEAARVELERVEGRLSGNQMLDRLVTDERLGWLRPLTALIVAFDELLDDEAVADEAAHLARAITLLTVDTAAEAGTFAIEYARLLHDRAEITMAHAAVMRVLEAKR